MSYSLADLAWLVLLVLVCLYWWHAYGMKERALKAVRLYCRRMGLELLDDSVVLRAFWLKRDARGQLRMWRTFHFEFSSTGEQRYQGRVILLGDRVESIDVEAHRLSDE